ncbi:MAG TPA: septation protein A [Gammaproteobacteria bacterium]|nr:septation protein A [Gammaproteobacteria bacterium]
MKILYDFFPVVAFFVAFRVYGIYVATALFMGLASAQVGWDWLRHRRLDTMHVATAVLAVLFGGATLLLHDARFIKMKPTVLYLLMAAVMAGSLLLRRPLLARLMGDRIVLPSPVWTRLGWAWTGYFLACAAANQYVASFYSTRVWVDFKLFGVLTMTLCFVLGQTLYIARHLKQDDAEREES